MNRFQKFHTQYDWQNIDVTSINREQSHAPWGAYENAEQALSCRRDLSKWTDTLDGLWKFAYYKSPLNTDSFYEDGYDHSGWEDIKVPGNWEVQGFGEPIYTNVIFPWSYYGKGKEVIYPRGKEGERGLPNPPYIPEENPTGCYFRKFNISKDWMDREIFIHFCGVETVYYLWINGREVGYAQDSKLPSEFNITPYLKSGENTVALQVMRFADSTYLEDQDYWYLSGIFRSVFLYAKPKQRIVDWKIDAIPDLHYPYGTMKADVSVNRFDGFADYQVKLELFDIQDKLLASGVSRVNPQAAYRSYEMPTSNTARIELKVDRIRKWSPEEPNLYKAVITLISPDNEEIDFESTKIGFKKIEIVDGVIMLNGKRLIVKGVNRHEFEAHGGRTVSYDHMIEEIKLMKRLNINSVRTCHYPDDPIWYDLCDEWGILLICECNLETHGVQGALTHNPAWGTNFLERAIRMVLTHKNHPSIYSWSLGNESGVGANHAAMAGWIREYDTTRLCQYEAGAPGKSISDVRGNMYASQHHIFNMLTDATDIRPIVLVEYLYQIRNAGGGMHKFYDLVENYKRFQGGYIWDWQDKCLVAHTEDGTEYFAYGGDFNESFVEWDAPRFMTNNGIVLPDLVPKPAAYEAKQIYCPIVFEKMNRNNPWIVEDEFGELVIKNRNMFLDSSHYKVTYAVRENGRIIKEGIFELPLIKAEDQANTSFRESFDKKPNCEYHVEFTVRYAKKTSFAPEGFELGCYQFRLKSGDYSYKKTAVHQEKVSLEDGNQSLKVTGKDFSVTFDKEMGLISSYVKNQSECLVRGPVECFTRPYTGIDAKEGWGRYSIWRTFESKNLQSTLKEFTASTLGDKGALVETVREVTFLDNPYGISVKSVYTIYGDGAINVRVNFDIDPSLRDLPRVGVELVIPEDFESLEYFGMGPGENYRDRRHSARLGVFQRRVEDEHFPFIPPSENGGHEETKWFSLTDGKGKGIRVSSPAAFHFDVHHNTIEDYKNASHEHELKRRRESYLHIDAAHSGIGSDMSWSTALQEEDRVKAGNYSLEFAIRAE